MVDKRAGTKSQVLCYGGIVLDSIFVLPYQPKPGIAHIICEEHFRLGGGAANVAQWLGSWSVPTRLSGNVIGTDQYGDQIWQWLHDFPTIDLQYVERREDVRSLVARSIPFPDGNTYLFCSDFASAVFVPPTEQMLAGIQVLEVAFYYRNLPGNAASKELARLGAGRGIKIVAMDVLSTDHETLPIADIIINSAASLLEQHPGVNLLEHSIALQSLSKGVVITTDGSERITAIDRNGALYYVDPPKVAVTDSTGAGDSFRAGIIYGHLQGWPLTRSLAWAAAVGALQVQRHTTQDQPPSKNEILELAQKINVVQ